ncbi:MAG: hypothetical protein J5I47_09440 [Vicingus serpentipes]|nr:hypothetical protein [Vicingus serpentipes]
MNRIKSLHMITLQAILFVVFLVITFYFNRFAADDYHFIGELNNKSFQEIYEHLYFKWHGRWASNFLLLAFLQLRTLPHFLFFYGLLTCGVFYLGIQRLFYALNHYFNLSSFYISIYSILLMGGLFFCSSSPNEIWFWYTSSVVYFWSTIAFFYALSSFLTPNKKWLDHLIYILSLAYIGGSNEPLALLSISLFFIAFLKKEQIKLSIIGGFTVIIALEINYLSAGTLHRDEITPNLDSLNLVLYTGYGCMQFLFFKFHTTFLPALFFCFPFYLLGKKASYIPNQFKPIPQLLYSLLMIYLAVFFNQLMVIYALGGLSPARSSVTSSIVIVLILVRYLFLLGSHHKSKQLNLSPIIYFNVIGLIIFNIYFFYTHRQYAQAMDQRINFIKKKSNFQEEVYVPPLLLHPGYLYNAELKENPKYFVNQHLKEGLGIKSDILLKMN